MAIKRLGWMAGLIAIVAAWPAPGLAAAPRRPNVILILTDNQGAWTLGCYGNKDLRTPNIDRLAREGIRFTRCFSSNAVCSPTRATLLTGLIPSQHGVHCFLNPGEPQLGPKAHCTIAEFRTLPRILAAAGYDCGLSGKWHLGGNLRPQEGFRYWVTMPHGSTRTFYDAEVIEDGHLRKEPRYLTDFWTDHGIRFIEQAKDRPFFLMLAYNGPYGLGPSLLRPARNRHAAYYAEKDLPSFPRETAHPWLHDNREYLNNLQAMRRYAAEVSGVDDGVGRILDTLQKHHLEEKTLVLFTADQGWGGGQHGIWGMGDHTRPLHAFDETMHVPLIYRHLGQIPAGQQSELLVSNYDMFPTVLEYLDLKAQLTEQPLRPGHSYAGALRGKPVACENRVFYEFENTRAVRTPGWKYIERFRNGPNELYDLGQDPGERKNLIGEPAGVEQRARFQKMLEEFFRRYADPRYDLWHGGKSKAPLLVFRPTP
jgi:arylsulfatase A-like enzyme